VCRDSSRTEEKGLSASVFKMASESQTISEQQNGNLVQLTALVFSGHFRQLSLGLTEISPHSAGATMSFASGIMSFNA
jgi:hypothetical protein